VRPNGHAVGGGTWFDLAVTGAGITHAGASSGATRALPRWRRLLVGFLVVVGCVVAPLIVVSVWTRNQILDTSRYVENVTPLASDPAIIAAAADDATEALFEHVDIERELDRALPERADFLVSPLSGAIQQFTREAAERALESDAFQTIWQRANEIAHEQVDAALTGGGDVVSTREGRIVLDLTPVIERIRDFLRDEGITIFDDVPIEDLALRFQLFDASALRQAQTAVELLETITYVLPVIMVACFGVAIWLSPNRRRTIIRGGIGVAIAATVVSLAVAIGRTFYLDSVSGPGLPRDALAATWDTLIRFLRGGLRALIAAGLLVAAITWVLGPSRWAVRVRTTARDVVGGIGDRAEHHGLDFGGFGRFVHTYRVPLRVAGVVVGALYLLARHRVSASSLVWTVVALLVYLGLVEFFSRAATVDEDAPAR
jgi:hypothetical protein